MPVCSLSTVTVLLAVVVRKVTASPTTRSPSVASPFLSMSLVADTAYSVVAVAVLMVTDPVPTAVTVPLRLSPWPCPWLVPLGAGVSVVAAAAHQLAGPDLAGHRVLQVLWAPLYTQVFALVLIHRVITSLRNTSRHRMRVAAVQHEAPGVVSIIIEAATCTSCRPSPGSSSAGGS